MQTDKRCKVYLKMFLPTSMWRALALEPSGEFTREQIKEAREKFIILVKEMLQGGSFEEITDKVNRTREADGGDYLRHIMREALYDAEEKTKDVPNITDYWIPVIMSPLAYGDLDEKVEELLDELHEQSVSQEDSLEDTNYWKGEFGGFKFIADYKSKCIYSYYILQRLLNEASLSVEEIAQYILEQDNYNCLDCLYYEPLENASWVVEGESHTEEKEVFKRSSKNHVEIATELLNSSLK